MKGWHGALGVLTGWLLMGAAWAGSCQVMTPAISLGDYNSYAAYSATATSQMTVKCTITTTAERTTGVVATVSLSAGYAGQPADRTLTQGAERLHYNIYLDPNATTVFGDGTQGTQNLTTCQGGSACGSTTSLTQTLYTAAPPHQDVAAGAYQDALTLQVMF